MRLQKDLGEDEEDIKMLQNSIIVERNARNYNKVLGVHNINPSHQRLSHLSFNDIAIHFWETGFPSKRAN